MEETGDNNIRQNIRKLCEGNAESFIRWNKQLDIILADNPCENAKSKFAIVENLMYKDLVDTSTNRVTAVTSKIMNKKRTYINRQGSQNQGKSRYDQPVLCSHHKQAQRDII